MSRNERLKSSAEGFEGEFTRLGLADVIQLNAQNRFSGCIDVDCEGRRGLIFLRDGEIVHAEHGGLIGEAAFYEIVSWPGGRFSLQENVATTRSTIKKACSFLILEAHRLMDERRAGHAPEPTPPAADTAKPTSAGPVLEKLRAISGVVYAVLQGKDGRRIGDDTYEAEVVAGQAQYLAMAARQLSATLKAGDVQAAVAHGTSNHLLLLVAKNRSVAVLLEGDAKVGAIEVDIRKTLAAGR
jgi:predicted regulator of Ras-like GTPase activity (Roadblock/LC7/MglB family)